MWYLTFKRESVTLQRHNLQGRKVLLVVPLCLVLLDVLNGSNFVARLSDATYFNYNIAGSALVKVGRDIKASITKRKIPQKELGPNEYAMSGVRADLTAGILPLQHVVLVIVESWGLSNDTALNQAIVAPLTNPSPLSRYQVRRATVPFYGATVSAELRELYARRASDPEDVVSGTSLPALFAAKGYETVALHGFMPVFFGRNEWYPQAGFRTSLFINDIDKLQPVHERCGSTSFRGICDDTVPSLIKQVLVAQGAASAPKFIYWLTLNSHYPYASPDHPSHFACGQFDLSSEHQDICNLSAILNSTFEALGKLVSDPGIPPTRFIVVGDHNPPFLMRSKDGLYDKKSVPMIELIPKVQEISR
ncbi:sulfatase-like hydrolase/transferase [Geotalea uraniireducens]|uniref:Phosphoglycerol transferase and related protein alkaline phosphatase superfamily-like protein n=1 Tax=Geotalea uraniireducens (strain Rf4) TaxID=351605 RepID=A5G6C3_GEOUR|nr:sulfatase-like hydrolase/transferase [Geotalea uraniireducens]ABQ27341.1 Phosphoglycerol transferase and related protein alkaline phosphatase superfamily-like protein [Geotalea uraniireducens Rf4]